MKEVSASNDWGSIDFDNLFLPGISVDPVIFGFHDQRLVVLLLKYLNTDLYGLPGGFIYQDEDGNQAAERVLRERTGLSDVFLKQFHTFADSDRNKVSFMNRIVQARGLTLPENHFLTRRFVSIAYYALLDFSKVALADTGLPDQCKWFEIDQIPDLIQDHGLIVDKALATLREDLDKRLVGFNLLPDTFTISEVQALYETILRKEFVRTNFQRTMLGLGVLEKVSKRTGLAHKSPYLYRLVNGKS